tara:strand:+ start:19 stop:1242 length:1224 start_codon:yes stop_codon:yes gene_type:complete
MATQANIDKQIQANSPFKVVVGGANILSAMIKVWIYTGTQGGAVAAGTDAEGTASNSRPAEPTYVLEATTVGDISNKFASFELASLLDGYIKETYNGTPNESRDTSVFFLDYQVTENSLSYTGTAPSIEALVRCAAYNGYTYFEEGLNAQHESGLMFSAKTLTKLADAPLEIGLDSNKCSSVAYAHNGNVINTKSISSNANSGTLITYSSNGYDDADRFEERVLKDGGIKVCDKALGMFKGVYEIFECDTIYVESSDGSVEVINVVTLDGCSHPAYRITFLNKMGALESLWMYGNSSESTEVKNTMYNINTSNYLNNGEYSIHEAQSFKEIGASKKKMKFNSGFYPEASNVTFQELFQSKNVWVEYNSQTLPINITSKRFKSKTHLNDNAINYTIEAEFAFNRINNI